MTNGLALLLTLLAICSHNASKSGRKPNSRPHLPPKIIDFWQIDFAKPPTSLAVISPFLSN